MKFFLKKLFVFSDDTSAFSSTRKSHLRDKMRQLRVGVQHCAAARSSSNAVVVSESRQTRRSGRAYSTRAHRLSTEKFDAPGAVVGVAPMAALEPAYDTAMNPAALLDQDIKTLLEARIPIQQLRELGKTKLSGRALMQWQHHVTALENKMNTYAKELFMDLSMYQLEDSQVRNFLSWPMATREMFRLARQVHEKEERYRREAAGLSLDGKQSSSSNSSNSGSGPSVLNSSVKDALDNFGSGFSFDELGFPLLGLEWEAALANRKGEFHWSDQPVVVLAVKNLRTALQPPTSAAGSKKNSLLTVLDSTPTAVLLERLCLIDFHRRKLILSERVERGDSGADYDPTVRHAEAWQNFSARLSALFDAPRPAETAAPSAGSPTDAAPKQTPSTPNLNAPSALVASILAEGDRLKKPIVESIERLLETVREEIRVVEQLAVNADTGAHVPASLPMTIADIESLVHRIRTHTISQSRLTATSISDRAVMGGMTAAAGRSIARPSAVTVGVPATLAPEAQRQLDDLKTQMVQLLEVLAAKVGTTSESIERRSVRDAEAGIVTGAKNPTVSDSVENVGLPPWRQKVYTIPPNFLLSLKQVQWPRSQHDAYEYDRAPIRRFGRDGMIAVGVNNSWTDHIQQLRKSLGPDIADISQMAAITEAAASAAASISGSSSRPAAAAASATASAAGSS
jgi:hypothetical protein